MSLTRSAWLWAEWAAGALGLAALTVWGLATLAGITGAREDLMRFDALRAPEPPPVSLTATATPDTSDWGFKRIEAWRAAATQPAPLPLAVLRIPKIHLEVAVLPGTSDFVLNRALG